MTHIHTSNAMIDHEFAVHNLERITHLQQHTSLTRQEIISLMQSGDIRSLATFAANNVDVVALYKWYTIQDILRISATSPQTIHLQEFVKTLSSLIAITPDMTIEKLLTLSSL